jgi:hypothetical protein
MIKATKLVRRNIATNISRIRQQEGCRIIAAVKAAVGTRSASPTSLYPKAFDGASISVAMREIWVQGVRYFKSRLRHWQY